MNALCKIFDSFVHHFRRFFNFSKQLLQKNTVFYYKQAVDYFALEKATFGLKRDFSD